MPSAPETPSVDEITKAILDAVFASTHLNRAEAQPVVRALVSAFFRRLMNKLAEARPVKPARQAIHLHALERVDFEYKQWKKIALAGCNEEQKAALYERVRVEMELNGFQTPQK